MLCQENKTNKIKIKDLFFIMLASLFLKLTRNMHQ
jgi:hypothetical protein